MLPRRVFLIQGTMFFCIGALFILNAFIGMTGFAIIEIPVKNTQHFFIGLWFITAAILTMMAGEDAAVIDREKEGGLAKIAESEGDISRIEPSPKIQVVMDADFLKNLEETYKGPNKLMVLPPNTVRFFRHTHPIILPTVEDEITYRKVERAGKKQTARAPLVSNAVQNYLYGPLTGIRDTGFQPSSREREIIQAIYKTVRDPRKKSKKPFEKTGDCEMLCFALYRRERPTLILSSDNEVYRIAEVLRRDYKVRVQVWNNDYFERRVNRKKIS